MTSNNKYLTNISGDSGERRFSNNKLLKIIVDNGRIAGDSLTPEQLELLNSTTTKLIQQELVIESIQEKDSSQDISISDLNSRVNSASTTVTNLSSRVGVLEDNYVDYAPTIQDIQTKDTSQDTLISTATSKNEEQDLRLDTMETTSTSHESRVTTLESTIANKADLVSGKIPLNQLPDLPVGRKVSVANEAERLALDSHPDLTIAYQLDTADAWVLDSNEDPSLSSNWDKLGNAQSSGVQSFNGRTGNIDPQSGDYTAAMITTNGDRNFISDTDRTRWDDKATPAQVAASTSALRSEVVAGYIPTSQRASVNGIATLGSDGKVPSIQLPPLGLTTQQALRLDQIEETANLADAKGDSAANNILAVDTRLTQVDNDSKTRDTNLSTTLNTTITNGLAGKANTSHTHTIANVTGLQAALNAQSNNLVGEFLSTSSTQTITVNIPETAADLLRIELFIPNTIQPAWVGMTINGVVTTNYKTVSHSVNSMTYNLNRWNSEASMRIMSGPSGPQSSYTSNVRIQGTISNISGEMKIWQGTSYFAGTDPSQNPDVTNSYGSAHTSGLINSKITSLTFRTTPTSAGFTSGSHVRVYEIK